MRKIYLLTSIAALGVAATQCGTPADNLPAQGGATFGGASTTGGQTTTTSGGAPMTSGGAPMTSGGAPMTSGGATSGGSLSGGTAGSSAGTSTSGGAGSSSGGAGGASAGSSGAGAGGASAGEAGKAGGGAAGTPGGGMAGGAGSPSGGAAGSAGASGSAGNSSGGAAGSAGAGGTGGAASVAFADVAKILNANCGMFCHKAGNDKGHIVLSNTDNMLYTRLTTALTTTPECKGATLANPTDASKSLLPLIVSGTVNTLGCDNVPRMPNECSTTSGTPGGNPPNCLSKADITTIQNWVNQGAKMP